MSFPGLFRASALITKNGFKYDELRSAIQKYCRRGETHKMIACVREMNTVDHKSVRTNIYNRLGIISCEDVSFREWKIIVAVYRLLNQWRDEKKNDTTTRHYLDAVSYLLSEAKKARVCSDVRAAFCFDIITPPESVVCHESKKYLKPKDTVDKELFSSFVYYLKQSDPRAFYFAFEIMNKAGKGASRVVGKNKTRGFKTEYILWEVLFEIHPHPELLEVLLEYSKHDCREHFMFLITGMLTYIFRDKIPDGGNEIDTLVKTALNKVQDLKIEIQPLDEYVIDMHTKSGRDKGKSYQDFADEGSLINNPDDEVINTDWRESYLRVKKAQSETKQTGKHKAKKSKEEELEDITSIFERPLEFCFSGKSCGAKKPVIWTEDYVYKEVTKSTDYGQAMFLVDSLKSLVGLNSYNPVRVKSSKTFTKKDPKIHSYTDNYNIVDKDTYFIRMERFPGTELMESKHLLVESPFLLAQYVKICAYRYLWNTSDTNFKNILFDPEIKGIYSIDEMVVFNTKDKGVFGKCESRIKRLVRDEMKSDKSLIRSAIGEVQRIADEDIIRVLKQWDYEKFNSYVLSRRDNVHVAVSKELESC